MNRLLVEHVADLQVLELAGLLGVLLEIMEVVAEVEGSGSFSMKSSWVRVSVTFDIDIVGSSVTCRQRTASRFVLSVRGYRLVRLEGSRLLNGLEQKF